MRLGPAVLEKIFKNGRRTDNGQWTDDVPWLYYKLTNEPKGSGELTRGEPKGANDCREIKKRRS